MGRQGLRHFLGRPGADPLAGNIEFVGPQAGEVWLIPGELDQEWAVFWIAGHDRWSVFTPFQFGLVDCQVEARQTIIPMESSTVNLSLGRYRVSDVFWRSGVTNGAEKAGGDGAIPSASFANEQQDGELGRREAWEQVDPEPGLGRKFLKSAKHTP